jgi:hypothetical protein
MDMEPLAPDFSDLLDSLVREAVARDVPVEVAEQARSATTRAVSAPAGVVTSQMRRRVEAYFSAVVRRRVVRRSASPRAAARFVVAAVVEDLRSTGRSGADIWDELQRGWAQRVPGDVLEEYRLRLCG